MYRFKENGYVHKENDNTYLNVTFDHNFYDGENPSPAIVDITKTTPIIDVASDYYVSVIRFDIPLNEVPLYIFPIIPNQSNPNLSPAIIGITTGGTDYPQNLIYVPDNDILVPTQNVANQQVVTPYYFVFAYQNMIDSINTALAAAFVAAGSPSGGDAPYFILNPATSLISLIVTADFANGAGNYIFLNEYMVNFLDSFYYDFIASNVSNGHDYNFILASNNASNIAPSPPYAADSLIFTEEYPSINEWTALRKILITTSSIPVTYEIVPSANPNVSGVNNAISSGLGIITDFVPAFEIAGQTRSIAYYYPSGQYRLVDMNAETPLYKANLQILWQDKSGNLFPILISVLQQASIKLIFARKTLYKNMNALLSI